MPRVSSLSVATSTKWLDRDVTIVGSSAIAIATGSDAALAGLLEKSLLPPAVALNRKSCQGSTKIENLLYVRWAEHRFASTEVPSNELNGQPTLQHNASRLRVAPDVVFGGRRDVALATGRSAHDHAAAHQSRDARVLL
jgi:hypothetical protein